MSDYLDQLNPVQREAAANYRGPSIIVAGAGSGKTRVLTYRIAHMLEQGVSPYNILALTFTNKAASEMKERINTIVTQGRSRGLWMGTFHSIFARILRREADKLEYPATFTIYDSSDSRNVVRTIIKELNLNDEQYKPADIAGRISLAKNNLITPDTYESNTVLVAEDRERRRPQFADIYRRYARKCKDNGAMDFDDLLLNMNILFRDFPDVLAYYQDVFKYVMVDEYQDTNTAQYLIVKKIAEKHKNICVVGDDAQSIYSFRGAKIENILRFQQDYPDAKVYKLEQNYRSTQTIVNASNSIIEKNKRQLKKKSFSSNDVGEKIRVFRSYTDKEESLIVVSNIFSLVHDDNADYSDIAILYRTNAQSRSLEEALRRRNIPYKIYGGQSFYQRKEIKDLLAYIRLIVNHKDNEALRRIINYPTRGIGDVTIGKIAEFADRNSVSMWEVISTLSAEQMGLRGAAGKKIKEFVDMITELSNAVYTTPAYELGLQVATRSGILGSFRMQQTPEAMSVLENIDELLNSIASFTESRREEEPELDMITIDDWLQNVSLLTDMDNDKADDKNHITLMTVHSAKGLEFDHVQIVGMEENLFPSQMCADSPEGLEEERRLFYVALTRARKSAALTFSETRFRWGTVTSNRPSRFLRDIDPEHLELMFSSETVPDSNVQQEKDNIRTLIQRRVERDNDFAQRKASTSATPAPQPVVKPNMKSVGKRLAGEQGGSATPSNGKLREGSRVEHEKFGQGRIAEIEDTPNSPKVKVDFDSGGTKTLLLKYAKLTVLE